MWQKQLLRCFQAQKKWSVKFYLIMIGQKRWNLVNSQIEEIATGARTALKSPFPALHQSQGRRQVVCCLLHSIQFQLFCTGRCENWAQAFDSRPAYLLTCWASTRLGNVRRLRSSSPHCSLSYTVTCASSSRWDVPRCGATSLSKQLPSTTTTTSCFAVVQQ